VSRPQGGRAAERSASGALVVLQAALALVVLLTASSVVASLWALRIELGNQCVALVARLTSHPQLVVAIVPLGVLVASASRWVRSLVDQTRSAREIVRHLGVVDEQPPRLRAIAGRLAGGGTIRFSDSPTPVAFCYGARRPRVLVTRGLVDRLDDDELEAVLSHECHHAERGDPLRILLVRSAGRALGYLPGVEEILAQFTLLTEIAADRAAMAQTGSRIALASAVMKVAAEGDVVGARKAAISGLASSPGRVDLLIAESAELPSLPRQPLLVTSAGVLVIALASLTPVLATGEPHRWATEPCPLETLAPAGPAPVADARRPAPPGIVGPARTRA